MIIEDTRTSKDVEESVFKIIYLVIVLRKLLYFFLQTVGWLKY